jgi:hypothetical protein
MKAIIGIIIFLAIVGGVVYFQFFGGEPAAEEPQEESPSQQEESSQGGSFWDRLLGSDNSQPESEEVSFFDRLFGESSQESPSEEKESIWDKLFGGGGGSSESTTGGDSFFQRLFGGGSTNEEQVGVDTEEAESPELAPPKRFNASPTGEIPYYTKKTDISLDTDKVAVCRYGSIKGTSYDKMRLFSNTGATHHSTEVTGLSEGQEYTYYVRCQDLKENKNQEDFIISFEVSLPKDETPPKRINPYPTGDVFPAGTTSALISVATDEPAHCRYDDEQGTDYSSMSGRFSRDEAEIYHTATVSGLEDGEYYSFFVRCSDENDNENDGDVMIHFSVSQ